MPDSGTYTLRFRIPQAARRPVGAPSCETSRDDGPNPLVINQSTDGLAQEEKRQHAGDDRDPSFAEDLCVQTP